MKNESAGSGARKSEWARQDGGQKPNRFFPSACFSMREEMGRVPGHQQENGQPCEKSSDLGEIENPPNLRPK